MTYFVDIFSRWGEWQIQIMCEKEFLSSYRVFKAHNKNLNKNSTRRIDRRQDCVQLVSIPQYVDASFVPPIHTHTLIQ